MIDLINQMTVMTGCAVCFGDPNSLLTKGLNWGIFSLLGIVFLVLFGCAAFFLQVRNRLKNFSKT